MKCIAAVVLWCLATCALSEQGRVPPGQRAVTFQGNGAKAMMTYAGVVAGLLQAQPTKSASDPLKKLFGAVDVLSSTSGGSIFTALLTHSPTFADIIVNVSRAKASDANATFYEQFIVPRYSKATYEPFLQGNDVSPELQTFFPDQETIQSQSVDIAEMLHLGGELPFDLRAGQRVNAWAKGKTWRICASIMSPSGDGLTGQYVKLYEDADMEIGYSVKNLGPANTVDTHLLVPAIPVHFSVSLGRRQRESLFALPLGVDVRLQYSAKVGGKLVAEATSAPLAATYEKMFDGAESLNLVGVVAASTSGIGPGMLMTGIPVWTAGANEAFHIPDSTHEWVQTSHNAKALGFAQWADSHRSGSPFDAYLTLQMLFEQPCALRASECLSTLAAASLHALTDGNFGDNPGILGAVAGGATEIVAFLNDGNDLYAYFDLQGQLFFDPVMGTAIFNTSAESVKALVSDFQCLESNAGDKHLHSFCFGTIETYTKENIPAGVHGGTRIRLNLIIVDSSLGMQVGNQSAEFVAYSELVGEIVGQMAGSRVVAQELLKFFPQDDFYI